MNNLCVECGNKAEENHHVIPRVLGGTFTVPLCSICHGLVHGLLGRGSHGELTRKGLDRKIVAELAYIWFHMIVENYTLDQVVVKSGLSKSKVKARLKRVNEMDVEWQKELFTEIVGDFSLATYKLYRRLNDGSDNYGQE